MLFRGFRVGTVETSHFDPLKRMMNYQLFVNAPYDRLVTNNVRFWKDSGVALNLSASGMRVEMGSLTTLFAGGVSFDVPTGWELGTPLKSSSVTNCSIIKMISPIPSIPNIRTMCCSSMIRFAACSPGRR